MTAMGIFMVIFMGSVVAMFGSSNRSQAVAHTSQQLNDAFLWLDQQVRAADYVSSPGQGSDGDWYVEFHRSDPGTQASVCYQLRVDQSSEQLQQRSQTGTGTATAWQPLATGVTNGGDTADPPFARVLAGQAATTAPGGATPAVLPAAQLHVDLITAQGQGSTGASSEASVNLVALNADSTDNPDGYCAGMSR